MISQSFKLNQIQPLSLNFAPGQKSFFLKGFWLVSAFSFYFIITSEADVLSIVSALIIAVAALYPGYLWCRDHAKGLPLFPLLAFNYLFTHGFPLVYGHIKVESYSASEHFVASLTVASFLVVATFAWLSYVKKVPNKNFYIKEFAKPQVFPFFITALIFRIVYQVSFMSGFLWLILPSSFVSVLRALTESTSLLGIVSISYLLGRNLLKKNQAWLFLSIMVVLLFVTGASLYLNNCGLYILLGCIGWMLGSKKIPWRVLLISALLISFLNIGKGDTRHYYWTVRNSGISPLEYIQVYQDWINNSLEIMGNSENSIELEYQTKNNNKNTLLNRSIVIHMLLKVQKETGTERPYLLGRTYSIIPQLLVPRFLNPNKIRGAEANHILSVHYGLQTYRQTFTTSIGWGLLQEAYANFGWFGCWGLGVFLGSLYGWITRWSMNASSLSFRFLVVLLFMMLALKGEVTMGTFVGITFQSLVILSAIRMFFMKTVRVNCQC